VTERQPFDAERIFAVLDSHQVEYVVTGGVAMQVYGHLGMTNHVDLIPSPTPQNLERLADALEELWAHILNSGSTHLKITAETLPRATCWQLATRHGDIDVLYDPPGAAPFSQLQERVLPIKLGDYQIPIVGRDDLIKMTHAAGRPTDLADIAVLTEAEHQQHDTDS
jgi:hypothetical protein